MSFGEYQEPPVKESMKMITYFYVLNAVERELRKARLKFPKQDIWITLSALTEEIGELNQAILQYHHQPEKNVTKEEIMKEAVQSIVMVLRVILDCGLDK